MKRRFLVIVRAADRSLHPQWLAQAGVRNWDLVVHYHGADPQRYPSGDGVVRIDGQGPKWPALHKLLVDTRDAWRDYDFVWLPDDNLATSGADINRMFELMAALGVELAQPSLSWDSDAEAATTLHNPNFAVRFSSFVETWGPCFSRALLERVLPTLGESRDGAGLGFVWPRHLRSPATQCAIFDCVQVTRARTANVAPERRAAESHAETAALRARHGVADAIELSYGAIDRDARRFNLFDADSGEFVFRLCAGWLGRLADDPALLGSVFGTHAVARAEYLGQAPVGDKARPAFTTAAPVMAAGPAAAPLAAQAPAPAASSAAAGAALQRFKTAVAAASANSAGRVFMAG